MVFMHKTFFEAFDLRKYTHEYFAKVKKKTIHFFY